MTSVQLNTFFSHSRTATCWHLTSQPITPGGANTGQAVWGERCRRLQGSTPQRATPTSPSWAVSWTTSTSRSCIAARRSLLLWVQVSNAHVTLSLQRHTCVNMSQEVTSHITYLIPAAASLTVGFMCGKGEHDRKEGDVFVSLQTLFSIYFHSRLLFCLLQPPFLCPGHWMKNWSVVLSGWGLDLPATNRLLKHWKDCYCPLYTALYEYTRNTHPASMRICTHSCMTD